MEQKIAEITNKLLKEGVEKGELQAAEIIAQAQEKAAELLDEARRNAERTIDDAKRAAQELQRNVETELKMVGEQALGQVRAQVVDAILAKSVEAPIKDSLSNPVVMAEVLKSIAAQWSAGSAGTPTLQAILPEAEQEALKKAFQTALASELQAGMQLAFSPKLRVGFQLQPADGGYKLSFTDEDFAELFKDYLRPRTREMLFGA